ncbi:hypothetical protein PR202_gb28607 [Eleusine coracana subsp. coracana]|uniref:UBC core domain-containing protein n=1 Tax=Eleusine coracana subsp. coracana TaxID=191504 RepID=A0AAV5FXQ6_ELECO|nr:hypothetical protein QOZ80_8BG0647660 [Eleusine coracana subsp. coracana]GJN39485.1 hypothetical protein PR202_gb28607 [Eleusine coracana subsp. coracana]
MEDATGQQLICSHDLVKLMNSKSTHDQQGDRAMTIRSLPGRRVVVQRVDGASLTEAARDVAVVDRSYFYPGMVVARASDRGGGQVGVVTGAATALDLRDEDGVVVASGVPTAEVRRVRELCLGDYIVIKSGWLGRVFKVFLDVDVLFDGGAAVCRVMHADSKQMSTLQKDCLNSHTNSCFYPGQRVVDGGDVFWSALWLKGYWKPSYVEGTVYKVHTAAVLVHWVASSLSSSTLHVKKPPRAYQLIDNVTFFGPGDELNIWGAGDRCFFRNTCSSSRSNNAVGNNNPLFERAMCVTDTHTTVDVVWQDRSRQCGMPSVSLIPSRTVAHDFFPGQRVIVRAPAAASDDDGANNHAARVGVVRSFNCEDQTVCVVVEESAVEMEFSAYDVGIKNSNDAFYGNIVVRRRQPTMDGSNDLSWVGKIVDLSSDVGVKWGDGTTSKVSLDEIAVVKHTGVGQMLHEISRREATSSTANALYSVTARMTKWVGAFVQAVFRTVTSTMLAQDRRHHLEAAMEEASSNSDDEVAGTNDKEEGTSDVIGEGMPKADANDDIFNFLQFDVTQSPSDHHYLDTKELEGTSAGSRKWTKRVQKEWKILKNDLPAGTIYVRAFEDRMDLLRAAIVGACGTPYHDGLFFFDLHLPPSYPASPPQVSYRSFGLRVNPNLYESGTVCLSLLNTFGGNGTELWSPDSSTLLQVLISIQGLVLTAQPYYNEAGYAIQAGTPVGHRNELPYSENAYLLTLQTMLHLLRRPPSGFEDLMEDHFRHRGRYVLRACQAYLEGGCLVGTLDAEANATEASLERPCSAGFRLALANIVPRIGDALIDIGAQGCDQFNRLCVSASH